MQKIDVLLQYAGQKWQLSDMQRISRSGESINLVMTAHSALHKNQVILKIVKDGAHEIEALNYFDGKGCIKLLDYDQEKGLILLPWIHPGTSLRHLFSQADNQATYIFAHVVKELHAGAHRRAIFIFDDIEKIIDILNIYVPPHGSTVLFKDAYSKARRLLKNSESYLILHGDLHHENIIQYNNAWIAIDPKGIQGPLVYELARYLLNPVPDFLNHAHKRQILHNRISILAHNFCLAPLDLVYWAYIQAALSAIWAEENGHLFLNNYFLKCALFFKKLTIELSDNKNHS